MIPNATIFLRACLLAAWAVCALAADEPGRQAGRIIQYRGPMPLLGKELWGKDVELKFELYRTPSGGTPFWTEMRKVPVGADGQVRVDLGEVEPLPDEAFNTPFRFLSIWRGPVEFPPRKQVASVVYVAAAYEEGPAKATQAAPAPNRDATLGALADCEGFSMETHPRHPANWLEATATAARLGARLPSFDEWYRAYDGPASKQLAGMTGHYEWVLPWVYEPAIHGRMQELYRGKPVACYYEELSPRNTYPFRLVRKNDSAK